jgi:DNA (cytosine-5)-methyltransferase 1
VKDFKDRGFSYEYSLLNAADFGANTRRVRYFGVFKKDGQEIFFPKQTHIKRGLPNPENLPTWRPVRNVLELEEEGVSIFGLNGKNQPWATKTMIRVYKGMKKFYLSDDKFLTSYYGNGTHHSLDDPCNTLTCKERYNKVTLKKKWLVDTQFDNRGKSIDEPCQTLIARMDKKPVYLISGSNETEIDYSVEKPGVRPIERLMRYFMRKHNISDVKIRMLFLMELMKIQGFPESYILTGRKEDKLKFIGNSVVPLMAQLLVEENHLAA